MRVVSLPRHAAYMSCAALLPISLPISRPPRAAPHVGANLDVMHADTTRMRTNAQGLKPFVMTNLKTLAGVADVVKFIETRGMLKKSAPAVG